MRCLDRVPLEGPNSSMRAFNIKEAKARLGLGLRLVFTLEPETATLVRVGSHDEIRRYLKGL